MSQGDEKEEKDLVGHEPHGGRSDLGSSPQGQLSHAGSGMSGYLLDALDQANAQLRAREWQPISTAPKDGTAILGYWSPAIENGRDGIDVTCFRAGDWRDPEDSDSSWRKPTHWMPLPAPPVTK